MNKIYHKFSINLAVIILLVSLPILAMEKRKHEKRPDADKRELKRLKPYKEELIEDWKQYIEKLFLKNYCNLEFIVNSTDIFDALAKLRGLKNIFRTSKHLRSLKNAFPELNQQIQFYRDLLKRLFLEEREGQDGLYLKNIKWCEDEEVNLRIAKFIQNPKRDDLILNRLLSRSAYIDNNLLAQLIHLLIFFNADPDSLNDSTAPLMWAAMNGKNEAVQVLSTYQVNVNRQNEYGNTALIFGVEYDQIVEILLAKKANIYLRGNFGTAMDIAKKFGYKKSLELLEKHHQSQSWCTLF